jgi:hypothetical protein
MIAAVALTARRRRTGPGACIQLSIFIAFRPFKGVKSLANVSEVGVLMVNLGNADRFAYEIFSIRMNRQKIMSEPAMNQVRRRRSPYRRRPAMG